MFEVASVLEAFVPGVTVLERWTVRRSAGDRPVSFSFSVVLAGVAILGTAVLVDSLLSSFLGKHRFAMILRKAAATFLFGVAIRAFVESWAPLRDGLAAVEGPVEAPTVVTSTRKRDPITGEFPTPVLTPITPLKPPPEQFAPTLPPGSITDPTPAPSPFPTPPPIVQPTPTRPTPTPIVPPPITQPEPTPTKPPLTKKPGGFILG